MGGDSGTGLPTAMGSSGPLADACVVKLHPHHADETLFNLRRSDGQLTHASTTLRHLAMLGIGGLTVDQGTSNSHQQYNQHRNAVSDPHVIDQGQLHDRQRQLHCCSSMGTT